MLILTTGPKLIAADHSENLAKCFCRQAVSVCALAEDAVRISRIAAARRGKVCMAGRNVSRAQHVQDRPLGVRHRRNDGLLVAHDQDGQRTGVEMRPRGSSDVGGSDGVDGSAEVREVVVGQPVERQLADRTRHLGHGLEVLWIPARQRGLGQLQFVGADGPLAAQLDEEQTVEWGRFAELTRINLAQVLGMAYMQTRQPDKARRALARAFGVDAESAAGRLVAAQMMVRVELYGMADAELKAALAKNAPNKEHAVKLMEFLAQGEAQKIYADKVMEYPVKPGIEPSKTLLDFGSFKADALPLAKLGALRAEALKIVDRAGWR